MDVKGGSPQVVTTRLYDLAKKKKGKKSDEAGRASPNNPSNFYFPQDRPVRLRSRVQGCVANPSRVHKGYILLQTYIYTVYTQRERELRSTFVPPPRIAS